MEKAPPATFPRPESKIKPMSFPEDTYVNKFFQKHPDSKFEDAIKLKEIARVLEKRPPPNPYPSAIKEIEAEERKLVRDRFNNPETWKIVNKLRQERNREMMDRRGFLG